MHRPRVLAIDDNASVLRMYRRYLNQAGYDIEVANTGAEGVRRYGVGDIDVVFVDLKMPDMDGIEVIKQIRAMDAHAMVVMVTGYGTIESTVQAMKAGAQDCLSKPLDIQELRFVLERLVEFRQKMHRLSTLEAQLENEGSFEGMIGVSQPMLSVYAAIRRVAQHETTVLIQGETGTGKELVARAIHKLHGGDAFVPINCGALAQDILESELFGHEKGAFTGATERKRGLVELATGGTLFLDEIDEMSPALQVKLLRIIQEHEVLRVGGEVPIPTDFRLVVASNTDLRARVDAGTFRSDLFYRLNVVMIALPPLRNRGDDIVLLVKHFLRRFAKKLNRAVPVLSQEALMLLGAHPWPGNVRELENTVEQALIQCEGDEIGIAHLPEQIVLDSEQKPQMAWMDLPFREARQHFEKAYLEQALLRAEGVVAEAARQTGINRQHFYEKMKRYKIERD